MNSESANNQNRSTSSNSEGSSIKPENVRPGADVGACIRIDRWTKSTSLVKYYFLSHAHSDHMSGLKENFKHRIYCSSETGKILEVLFPDFKKRNLIRPMEVGKTYRLRCPTVYNRDATVNVTLLPAFHCVGAVMFLFEGSMGRVLYSGDIRIESDSPIFDPEEVVRKSELSGFKRIMNGQVLSTLYLDNTYFGNDKSFPSRATASKEITDLIVKNPDHFVLLALYRIGKEDLLRDIAAKSGSKIAVSEQRYDILEAINFDPIYTKNRWDTRIRVVHFRVLSKEIKEFLENFRDKVLAIIPSAHPVLFPDKFPWINGYRNNPRVDIKVVPYSDHSTHQELDNFLSCLKIKNLRPISKSMSLEERKRYECDEEEEMEVSESDNEVISIETITPAFIKEQDLGRKKKRRRSRSLPTGLPMTPLSKALPGQLPSEVPKMLKRRFRESLNKEQAMVSKDEEKGDGKKSKEKKAEIEIKSEVREVGAEFGDEQMDIEIDDGTERISPARLSLDAWTQITDDEATVQMEGEHGIPRPEEILARINAREKGDQGQEMDHVPLDDRIVGSGNDWEDAMQAVLRQSRMSDNGLVDLIEEQIGEMEEASQFVEIPPAPREEHHFFRRRKARLADWVAPTTSILLPGLSEKFRAFPPILCPVSIVLPEERPIRHWDAEESDKFNPEEFKELIEMLAKEWKGLKKRVVPEDLDPELLRFNPFLINE